MISNYGELRAEIQTWAARSDAAFVNQLPSFILLAEKRIYQGGKVPMQSPAIRAKELFQTADLTIVDGVAPLPARFLEATRIYFDGQPALPLMYISPRQFYTLDSRQTQDGRATWYTIEGQTFVVSPGVGSGTGKLGFHQAFTPLSEGGDGDSNALLIEYPNLYLHAALIEGFTFSRNSARAQEHFALYASIAEGVHTAGARGQRSGQSLAPFFTNVA